MTCKWNPPRCLQFLSNSPLLQCCCTSVYDKHCFKHENGKTAEKVGPGTGVKISANWSDDMVYHVTRYVYLIEWKSCEEYHTVKQGPICQPPNEETRLHHVQGQHQRSASAVLTKNPAGDEIEPTGLDKTLRIPLSRDVSCSWGGSGGSSG